MSIYKCTRCGYETPFSSHIKRHINRKKLCTPMIHANKPNYTTTTLDINTAMDALKEQLEEQLLLLKDKDRQLIEKDEMLRNKDLQLLSKDLQLKEKDLEIKSITKRIGNKHISNTITNNNTLLIVNSFPNTDISFLTEKDYVNCMHKSCGSIREFVKKVHCNPSLPFNNNIYISDINRGHVMTFDGKEWHLEDETILNSLIDNSSQVMEDKLQEWIDANQKYPDTIERFKRYIDQKENENVRSNILGDVKRILYNSRPRLIKN